MAEIPLKRRKSSIETNNQDVGILTLGWIFLINLTMIAELTSKTLGVALAILPSVCMLSNKYKYIQLRKLINNIRNTLK